MENGLQIGKMCVDILLMNRLGDKERTTQNSEEYQVFDLSNWVDGGTIYRDGKTGEEQADGAVEFHLTVLILKCLFGHYLKAWSFWQKSGLEPDSRDSVLNHQAMICARAKEDIKGRLEDGWEKRSQEAGQDFFKVMHLSLPGSTGLLS